LKQKDLIAHFESLTDKEKVEVLTKALSIKTNERTKEESICLALGYYRDLSKFGNWINSEW
jgi:hypothetical protein